MPVYTPSSRCPQRSRTATVVSAERPGSTSKSSAKVAAESPPLRSATYEKPSQNGAVAQTWQGSVDPQAASATRVMPGAAHGAWLTARTCPRG